MGIILQFPGGKKCCDCGCQIKPTTLRDEPHLLHCESCQGAKVRINANFAKSMRLTMDDIAKIMGYRSPQ